MVCKPEASLFAWPRHASPRVQVRMQQAVSNAGVGGESATPSQQVPCSGLTPASASPGSRCRSPFGSTPACSASWKRGWRLSEHVQSAFRVPAAPAGIRGPPSRAGRRAPTWACLGVVVAAVAGPPARPVAEAGPVGAGEAPAGAGAGRVPARAAAPVFRAARAGALPESQERQQPHEARPGPGAHLPASTATGVPASRLQPEPRSGPPPGHASPPSGVRGGGAEFCAAGRARPALLRQGCSRPLVPSRQREECSRLAADQPQWPRARVPGSPCPASPRPGSTAWTGPTRVSEERSGGAAGRGGGSEARSSSSG